MCHVIKDSGHIPFLRDERNPGRLIGGKIFTITEDWRIVPLYQTDQRYSMMATTEGLWIGAPARVQAVRFEVLTEDQYWPLTCYRLIKAGIHVAPIRKSRLDQYGPAVYRAYLMTWAPLVKFNSGEILFYDGYDVSVAKVLVPWEHVPPQLRPEEVWEMKCKERKILELKDGMTNDEALELLSQTDWTDTLVHAYVQSSYDNRCVYEVQIHKAVKSIPFTKIEEML